MSEEKMIGCCGLDCFKCEAYLATQANDPEKIAEVAKQWTEEYKTEIKPENVWCDGCRPEGRKCGHCGECEVRACCFQKSVDNCGACGEYGQCEKIKKFQEILPPEAKQNLEQ